MDTTVDIPQTSLKAPNVTRWNSTLLCLESVDVNEVVLNPLLARFQAHDLRLTEVEAVFNKLLIRFLHFF